MTTLSVSCKPNEVESLLEFYHETISDNQDFEMKPSGLSQEPHGLNFGIAELTIIIGGANALIALGQLLYKWLKKTNKDKIKIRRTVGEVMEIEINGNMSASEITEILKKGVDGDGRKTD